jgi:hypothetical protein
MTAVTINTQKAPRSVCRFGYKKDAAAHLRQLCERGLNVEDCVQIHCAVGVLGFRNWVIARPDAMHEFTWLMAEDGSWIRGRMYDAAPGDETGSPWIPMDGEPIPATFTHVTHTVPYHARAERYRTKSNGSCGRWVRGDDSVALCTCGWRRNESTRVEAQSAARYHRSNPEATR